MSQRDRRRDPYPWTWEPAAILLGSVGGVLVTGLQFGRSLANGLANGHWQLPPLSAWLDSTPAVLRGDAGAGLGPDHLTAANTAALYTAVAVVEVVLIISTLALFRHVARRWSPGRPRGFAGPAQIDHVLGVARLRRSAHLIRPDLHPQPCSRTGLALPTRSR